MGERSFQFERGVAIVDEEEEGKVDSTRSVFGRGTFPVLVISDPGRAGEGEDESSCSSFILFEGERVYVPVRMIRVSGYGHANDRKCNL
jgi:hypothetical protein